MSEAKILEPTGLCIHGRDPKDDCRGCNARSETKPANLPINEPLLGADPRYYSRLDLHQRTATMLRRLEWQGGDPKFAICPLCKHTYPHSPTCDLATLLRELP